MENRKGFILDPRMKVSWPQDLKKANVAPAPDRLGLSPSRLLQHFLVAAAVTIFCSMTLLAYAVSQSLQSSLTITAAEEGALLVDYFLGPYIQELTTAKTLSPETVRKLDELLKTKLGDRTKLLEISLRDGTLVYSTNKELIGSKFPSPAIDEAFLGKTAGRSMILRMKMNISNARCAAR